MSALRNKYVKYTLYVLFLPITLSVLLFVMGEGQAPLVKGAYFNGLSNIRTGNYEEAIVNFTECLDQNQLVGNPSRDMGYVLRAQAYNALGQHKLALADTIEGLKINPNSRLLATEKSKAHLGLNDYQEAHDTIDKSIKLLAKNDIIDPALLLQKLQIYSEMGDVDNVGKYYDKLIENNPKNIIILQERAKYFTSQGEYNKAIDDYTRILEVNPKHAATYNSRACVYGEIGNHELAEKDSKRYAELTEVKISTLKRFANKFRSYFKA